MADKYAMDCEMVESGNKSILARVSIVNYQGVAVYNKFVKPTAPVSDYRTSVSGITRSHLENGTDFTIVKREVTNILNGSILIGHSLQFDLEALGISHPKSKTRDLATFSQLTFSNKQPMALKDLASTHLGRNIQRGEHDSIEDAKACMDIYRKFECQWERNY